MAQTLGGKVTNANEPDDGSPVKEVTTTKDGTKTLLDVFNSNALVNKPYDSVVVTYPTTIQEVYIFKDGGVSGTTVATITVTYTDTSKENLSTVVKT